MARPTLLDIAVQNGNDAVAGLLDETTKASPEITGLDRMGNRIGNMGAARTITGISYKTLVRTALPTVAFRNANEGTAATKGTYENREFTCHIMNPRWEVDQAVADQDEDGPAAYIALEGAAIVEATIQHLASQFYYGTGNDAKGFAGLQAAVAAGMTLDAGGTTASTGSSVYAVRWGPQAVQWLYGNNGQLVLSDVRTETILDASNNPLDGYVQTLLARPGLQVRSTRAVARLKDATADSGKGVTDIWLANLLALFEGGWLPDVFFMTRRSLGQLQASRTATTPTGAPAPMPTEAHGIPIAVTDALTNTETLT